LRRANILACGIGLLTTAVEGDMNGLRLAPGDRDSAWTARHARLPPRSGSHLPNGAGGVAGQRASAGVSPLTMR
jgi:hypothetical protein